MFKHILLIALGGGFGAVARYLLAGWAQRFSAGMFPVGTLVVNLSGCMLIGCLFATLAGPYTVREEYRLALLVGVLGSFTTFSTFGWETFAMIDEGHLRRAAIYVVASNGFGLAAVWIGYRLASRLVGA